MTSPYGDQPGAAETAALVDLVRALSKQSHRYAEAARRRLGMNASDLTALGLVFDRAQRGESMTPGELALELDLSPSATTALVDRLESTGHIVRAPHDTDRRRVVLAMTPRASAVGRSAFSPLGRQIAAAVSHRDPQELQLAVDVLHEILEAIDGAVAVQQHIETKP